MHMLPTSMLLALFPLPQIQRPYDIGLERRVGASGPHTHALHVGYSEEAAPVETATNRQALSYRFRDHESTVAVLRPFNPRGGA